MCFLCLTHFCHAQEGGITKNVEITRSSKTKKVNFERISPESDELMLETDILILEYKIHGPASLTEDQFHLKVDGEVFNAKSNIKSLYGADKVFHYSNTLQLKPGPHEVQLCMQMGSRSSCSKTIKILGLPGSGFEEIHWIKPFNSYSSSDTVSVTSDVIPIELHIETNQNLKANDVVFKVNNHRIIPSQKVQIGKTEGGGYTIKTELPFNTLESGLKKLKVSTVGAQSNINAEVILNYKPKRPDLHLISIGTKTNLKYSVKDAIDFASIFKNQGEGKSLFNEVQIKTITGRKARSNEIRGIIEEFVSSAEHGLVKPEDHLMIFISSHGFLHDGEFRIQGDDFKSTRKQSTSVSFQRDIMNPLSQVNCKKLLFLDTCHSGEDEPENEIEIRNVSFNTDDVCVISSSAKNEYSYEDSSWRNGAFTEAIVRALSNGRADSNNDKIVSVFELFSFLEIEVPAMVLDLKNQFQHPQMKVGKLKDLSIFLIK